MKKTLRAMLLLALTLCLAFVLASCGDGDSKDNGNCDDTAKDGKVTYTVTALDSDGNPVKGVSVEFTAGTSTPVPFKTDKDGKASYTSKNTVTAIVKSVPTGYTLDKLGQKLSFDKDGKLTLTLTKLPPLVIKVVDQDGNPIKDVTVQMCEDGGTCRIPTTTDENGVATYDFEEGYFHAQLTVGEGEDVSELYPGYTVDDPAKYYEFVDGIATITLTKTEN